MVVSVVLHRESNYSIHGYLSILLGYRIDIDSQGMTD